MTFKEIKESCLFLYLVLCNFDIYTYKPSATIRVTWRRSIKIGYSTDISGSDVRVLLFFYWLMLELCKNWARSNCLRTWFPVEWGFSRIAMYLYLYSSSVVSFCDFISKTGLFHEHFCSENNFHSFSIMFLYRILVSSIN